MDAHAPAPEDLAGLARGLLDGAVDLSTLTLELPERPTRRERRAAARDLRRQLERALREGSGGSARRHRTQLAAAAAALVVLATAPAAGATITSSVSAGALTVTTSAGDDVTVSCASGNVTLNGADPGTGPAACNGITSVSVTGDGGDNNFRLAEVSSGNGYTNAALTNPNVVTVDGGAGVDTILGSPFSDSLLGGTEDDALSAGNGNDRVDGGDGNDALTSGTGNDSLIGGTGVADKWFEASDTNFLSLTPTVVSGTGLDSLNGVEGIELHGGASANSIVTTSFTGNVTLEGDNGNDTLTTGSGNDSLLGDPGSDSLSAGAGADTVEGGTNSDPLVDGGNDTDVIQLAGSAVTLTATSLTGGVVGPDTLASVEQAEYPGTAVADTVDASAFPGPTTLAGNNGNDTLTGSSSAANVLRGDVGTDVLTGGAANDDLNGDAGIDTLTAGGGDDTLDGGTGNSADTLDGGANGALGDLVTTSGDFNFTLDDGVLNSTGTGTDNLGSTIERASITGGSGNHSIFANAFTGKATLDGGAGNDTINGGSNDDLLSDPSGSNQLGGLGGADSINSGTGNETLNGGPGNDTINGLGGVDDMQGSTGNDSLTAGSGFGSTLSGDDDDDVLVSGSSADVLDGGNGADDLHGGGEDDTVDGGAGNDTVDGGSNGLNGDFLSVDGDVDVTLTATSFSGTGLGTDQVASNSLERASLTGGAGDNVLDASGFNGTVTLDGAAGGDTLKGGSAIDLIVDAVGDNRVEGNGSADSIATGNGNETVLGGPGDDTIDGSAGNQGGTDSISGDAGTDSLSSVNGSYVLTDATLTGNLTGGDTLAASLSGVERVSLTGRGSTADTLDASGFSGRTTLNGETGPDSIVGGTGPDSILGDFGNDTITGGPGADSVFAGGDDDSLLMRDSVGDTSECGDGTDSVEADPTIDLFPQADCESIDTGVPTVPGGGDGGGNPPAGGGGGGGGGNGGGGGGTGITPDRAFAGVRATRPAVSAAGVFSARVACPAGEVRCTWSHTLQTASPVVAKAKPKVLVIGRGSGRANGGRFATIRVRLSAKAKRFLKRRGRVTVKLVLKARDAAGNAKTTTHRFTLKAPKTRRR